MRAFIRWMVLLTLVFSAAGASVHAAEEKASEPVESGFAIEAYEVSGNTLFPADNLAAATVPFTGNGKTSADVEKARDALEKLYHEAGYPTVLVNIPEQSVEKGLVRLEVIESRIAEVTVAGNRHFSAEQILGKLPSLAQGEIVHLPAVQREIGALNRNPDLKVIPGLTPSRTIGYVDVELKAEDRLPLHGSLSLDNRSTHNTTALRANASLRYENLWHKGHSVSAQYQTSPERPSEVDVFSASYVLPWPVNRDRTLAFYGVRSNSQTPFGEGFQTVGKGYILGTRYVVPLPGVDDYAHNVTFGADYKNFSESTGFSGSNPDGDKIPISYLPVSLAYSSFLPDGGGLTQFSAALNLSLRRVIAEERQFGEKRFKARGNYVYVTLGAERSQRLPAGFGFHAKAEGQKSSQPLVSNEQFSAGGMESVRGYKEGEGSGDDAVRGSMELLAPEKDVLLFGPGRTGARVRFTPFAFYDAAILWTQDPLPGQLRTMYLEGAGLGAR